MHANGNMGKFPVVLNQPNSIGPEELIRGRKLSGASVTAGLPPPVPVQQGIQSSESRSLQALAIADRIMIKHKMELLEIALGCETENSYEVLNEDDEVIFDVQESSDFSMRCLCGPLRPIWVDIRDPDGNPVIFLDRPLACEDICFPCCLQKMFIQLPPGHQIGGVEQKWGIIPTLHIKDETNQVIFVIKGPICQFSCRCGDVDFMIYAADGASECGKISKKYNGFVKETFTDLDVFSVKFPPRIPPQLKVLIIAAGFLIDYMYFESSH